MSRLMNTVGIPAGKLYRFQNRPERLWPNAVDINFSGTTITSSATPHAVGAWTELIAVTSGEVDWLSLHINATASSAVDTRALVDIGIGAAAAEVMVVSSLPAGFTILEDSSKPVPGPIRFPSQIPKGSRISARLRALIASETAVITTNTLFGGLRCGSVVDTYGADTAASQGTALPTTNTYVEFTAATTDPYQALVLLPSGCAGTAYTTTAATHSLAIGPAAAETVIATQEVQTHTSETIRETCGPTIYVGNVPKGTRLAVKTSVGSTFRGAIVLGIRY